MTDFNDGGLTLLATNWYIPFVYGIRYVEIRYDTIEEINVDSKAEYTA